MSGWIGVDLDETLMESVDWSDGPLSFGRPVPAMVDKVREAIGLGHEVRIFTARASEPDPEIRQQVVVAIQQWCRQNVGVYLAVTNVKDYGMIELWDDRAVQVVPNTGEFVGESSII